MFSQALGESAFRFRASAIQLNQITWRLGKIVHAPRHMSMLIVESDCQHLLFPALLRKVMYPTVHRA